MLRLEPRCHTNPMPGAKRYLQRLALGPLGLRNLYGHEPPASLPARSLPPEPAIPLVEGNPIVA